MKKLLSVQDIYILAFCCSITIILFALNYSGFCVGEFRYLSSQEKMESLFNRWNRLGSASILIDGKYQSLKQKNTYANFAEFVAKHPNCCEIDPGGGYDMGPPRFTDRITGHDSAQVIRLKFNEEFIAPNGNIITKEIIFSGRLQNCGEYYL